MSFRKRNWFVLFFVFIWTGLVTGKSFITQKDSYFGYHRTKIFWTIGNGVSTGWSQGLINGLAALRRSFDTRIKGYVKPEKGYIKYFYMDIIGDYSLYEDIEQDNIHELLYLYSIFGLGFNIIDNTVLYGGLGAGRVLKIDRFGVSNPDNVIDTSDSGMTYVVNMGVEYYLSKMISIYIDEKYFYNRIKDTSKFIPAKYDNYRWLDGSNVDAPVIDDGDNFNEKVVAFSELSFSIGVRFYWGQDMFWLGGFWEKN